MRELAEIATWATHLADRTGERILERYTRVQVEQKPDGTEVTVADRDAELFLREAIERAMPDAAILGEEHGGPSAAPDRGDLWILDPIDGTRSFVCGNPLFGTLIGLVRDGRPVLGVCHMPALGETLVAWEGGGCWWSRAGHEAQRCFVRDVARVEDAWVGLTGPHDSEWMSAAPHYRMTALARAAKRIRWGGDCYVHAMVARGGLQLGVDPVMQPWDIAALVPCVRESGGWAGTVGGDEEGVVFGGSLLSASTPALAAQAVELLKMGGAGDAPLSR